jgi:hypothetical protein
MGEGLLEELAAHEHDQWVHWTTFMLANLTPENITRWQHQVQTPYSGLSEKEKESDRAWARHALAIIRRHDAHKFAELKKKK